MSMTPRNKIANYIGQLRKHIKIPLFATAYTLIINQVFSAALGMLYWALAANLYNANVVGQNSTLISTVLLLGALAEFSLKAGMGRFVPRAGRHIRRLIITTYITTTLAALTISAIFFNLGNSFGFTDSLMAFTKVPTLFLWFLPIIWTIFYIQDGILTGLHEAKWVLYENLAYNLIKLLVLILLFFKGNNYGLFFSWFIPVPFIVIFVNWLIFTRFIPQYLQNDLSQTGITFREVALSVGGDHIGTLLAETGIRVLPLLVLNLLGESASAYFYEAWLIGNTIYLVAYNFASSFAVEASSNPQNISTISLDIVKQKARIIVPLAIGVFLFAHIGLSVFGLDYAKEGTTLLRWLSIAAIPMILNIWYLGYARITRNNLGIIRNQGLTCLITLGLSYILIKQLGITGVGVAWFIAQSVVAIIVFFEFRKVVINNRNNNVQS